MIFVSAPSRRDRLAQLSAGDYDVLVIGGGIVGSGIARDAAMRGLRTAVVEQHDFAYGTSSRSSRLLHGGLRYLEQGHVGLVREASIEKKTLARIAPHLARPLGFIFPAYRGSGRPLWQLRIGVQLYDLLCSGNNFQRSRGFSAPETAGLLPQLNVAGLAGSVRYFDALTNDSRLVIDTLRSAERDGATLANYTRFTQSERRAGAWDCMVEDVLTKSAQTVRARVMVNATGPWAQKLPHSAVRLRLSKGIHLVIERARLNIPDAVVITEGKRLIFVLPWGDRVILGTTDTDYQGAPEDVSVEASDVAYVLRAVNDFFPPAKLSPSDIVSAWAGVRPLIANPDGTPSDISRAHQIHSPQPGWWDVSGGKLTTYRLMAEQTVDQIVRHLAVPRRACRTALEPLLPLEEVRFSAIEPAEFSAEAVDHFVQREWAVSLADVMIRRSGWHYYFRDAAAKATQVAAWMAASAGWSRAQLEAALADYHAAAALPIPPAGSAPSVGPREIRA